VSRDASAEPADPFAEAAQSLDRIDREAPGERSETFDACVEDIRRLYISNSVDLFYVLEDRARRRLGLAPTSAGAMVLSALVGVGVRLAVVLVVTAVSGQWTVIPWGWWAVIFVFYGLGDAGGALMSPPLDQPLGPRLRRITENWTALLPTIVRESDLRDLAEFTRRWIRPRAAVGVGVAVAAMMLLACLLLAPTALRELPTGSLVLLALLLFDFGANVVFWGNLFNWSFMAREARYEHRLFGPSPAAAPEVHKVMRKTTNQGSAAGLWITIFFVLTWGLVSWDSPLVLPLAAGFVVFGYLSTIGLAFSNRASVRKIVERVRDQRLAELRDRIEAFPPRYTDLTSNEVEDLRGLLSLHNMIRDAPTSPTAAHTIGRTAAALILPSIMFVVSVFGEVSAERILDSILP
jgi:hypothetical protein